MHTSIAHALGLEPASSSSKLQETGTYLYIYADGYNQSLHSVDVDGEDDTTDYFAEESEPIGLGIAIKLSQSSPDTSDVFQRILDGSINRGLVELEAKYLECKNAGAESQGIAARFFRLKPQLIDLIEKDASGDWEYLYSKHGSLQYIGECSDYDFEENDDDVFTAGYTIEEVLRYALADIDGEGSLKVKIFSSSEELIKAAGQRGLFAKPSIVDEFKLKYAGKSFTIFGSFDWCQDLDALNATLQGLGLQVAEETERPEVVFVGQIDTDIEGIYKRWEALVSSYPIQHGEFSEPSLEEVFKAAT
jgi:hypothetical protein